MLLGVQVYPAERLLDLAGPLLGQVDVAIVRVGLVVLRGNQFTDQLHDLQFGDFPV